MFLHLYQNFFKSVLKIPGTKKENLKMTNNSRLTILKQEKIFQT